MLRYTALPGISLDGDENSDCPDERSLLVPVIGQQPAQAPPLGQLAILWYDKNAVPLLVMLNTGTSLPGTNNDSVM